MIALPTLPSRRRHEGVRRPLLVVTAAFLAFLAVAPRQAAATTSESGGRIYNPSHLRSQPAKESPGRLMKQPKAPDPPVERPLHSSAAIPDPSPQLRGGSGFKRNGKFFYAEAQPVTLTHKNEHAPRHETIPNPEAPVPRRRVSAAER